MLGSFDEQLIVLDGVFDTIHMDSFCIPFLLEKIFSFSLIPSES